MDRPAAKEINLVRCLKCHKIFKCSRYDTAILLEHIRTDHPEVHIIDTEKAQSKLKTVTIDEEDDEYYQSNQSCFCTGTNQKSPAEDVNKRKNSKTVTNGDSKTSELELSQGEHSEYENSDKDKEESDPQFARDVYLTQYSITSEILDKYPEIKDCEYCPSNPNAQVIYTRRYKLNTPTATSRSSIQQTPQKHNLYRTSIEKWRPANGTIYCPKCGCMKRPLVKTRTERFSHNECVACCLLSCWPFCFLPWLIPGYDQEYLHCSNCKTFLGLYDRNTNCIRPNRLYVNSNNQNQEKSNSVGEVEISDVSSKRENISNPPSSTTSGQQTQRLPSIVIDGKELPPDMVAKLQKFKKYGALAGIDLDAFIDNEPPNSSTNPLNRVSPYQETNVAEDKAPSVGNISKTNAKK